MKALLLLFLYLLSLFRCHAFLNIPSKIALRTNLVSQPLKLKWNLHTSLLRSSAIFNSIEEDAIEEGIGSWSFVRSAGRRCFDLIRKLLFEPSFRQELWDMCAVRWESVFRNLRTGDAGRRGEEWVVAQLVLFAFITMGINPLFVFFIRLLGLGVGGFGAYMLIRSAWILKENLSPFPMPVDGNYLITTDLYSVVRHPLYGGLILFCVGISLISNSCDRLIFTLALAALLGSKADREEQALASLHPLQYVVYLNRTKQKFVPYVF